MNWKFIIKKIFYVLNKKDKFLLALILISIFISAILEMLTISSLIPFLDIMLSPKIVYENFNYQYLVISREIFEKNPLAYITFVFILIISFATIFKLLVLKLILRVTTIVGSKISSGISKYYITILFEFTKFNTSNLILF